MKKILFTLSLFLVFANILKSQCTTACSVYATTSIVCAPVSIAGHSTITTFTNLDNSLSSSIPIGFTFTFFCTTYTNFVVSTNGFISFSTTSTANGCCNGAAIPNAAAPNKLIAFHWNDLDLSFGGAVTYSTIGTTPNRKCVITYTNVAHHTNSLSLNSGQIILYETTNQIEIHSVLASPQGTFSGTQGIENTTGTVTSGYASPGCNATTFSLSNMAYRFWYGGAPAIPSAILGNTIVCTGSTQTYSLSSVPTATSYNWLFPSLWSGTSSTNTISKSVGSSGTVSVSATNSCGTSGYQTLSVTVNPTPAISITSSSTTICSNKSATLTATGGISYTWTPGGVNTSTYVVTNPTVTNNYSVTVTSTNGCTKAGTITVFVLPAPTISVSANPAAICPGKTATLTSAATGSATLNWIGLSSGASNTVNPAVTKDYTVIATAPNSCSQTAVITVTVLPIPSISVSASPTVICTGKSVTLTAVGCTSYSWSSGTTATQNPIVLSPTTNTNVSVIGTLASTGCTNSAVQSISVNALPVLTITPSSSVICSGKTATLTAAGCTSYSWSNGPILNTSTVSPITTSSFAVSGTLASTGCINTAVQSISVNATPTVAANGGTVCTGKTITLTATGCTSYSWSTGSSVNTTSVSPINTSTYVVYGTSNNCVSANTAVCTVTVIQNPTVTPLNSGTIACTGDSFTFNLSGATTYSILNSSLVLLSSGTNPTISPLSAGTIYYNVIGKNASGCVSQPPVTFQLNVNPSPTITAASKYICLGNSQTLSSNPSYQYTWTPGGSTLSSIVVTPSVTTNYTLRAENNGNGCIRTKTISVTVNAQLSVSINASSASVCKGDTAILTPIGANTYTWVNPGFTSTIIAVSPTVATTYTILGSSGPNCSNTASQLISINPDPILSISGNTFICANSSAILTAAGAQSYTWNAGGPTTSTISVTPSVSTVYSVSGTNSFNCSSSKTIQVQTTSLISPSICLVTVDSNSTNNEIYWDKSLYPAADTFIVLRLTSVAPNVYTSIERIYKTGNDSYVDTNRTAGGAAASYTGNPDFSAAQYKLAYVDTCNNLSDSSSYIQSMFIQENGNGNFTWNAYNIGGVIYAANYTLYRRNLLTGLTTSVGSTPFLSATDQNFLSYVATDVWYVTADYWNCVSGSKTTANKTRTKSNNSNEKTFPITGIKANYLSENNFKIYPNPAQDKFIVSGEDLIKCKVDLTDILGRNLEVPQVKETNTIQFDVSDLKQGLYLLRISRGKESLVKKVVVE